MVRATEAGHDILIHRAMAGSTFAEASLFDTHYHCHAIVRKKACMVECSRASVLKAYRSDADFALSMSALFARQMQKARKRLELVSIRDAEERVYNAMLEGLLGDDIKSFATDIALSAEAVYRSLSKLTRAGRIRKTGYGRYEA